jgi:hypothetical protein
MTGHAVVIAGGRPDRAYAMTTTIEELMESALDARRVAQNAIRAAVREARAADWLWDRISAALAGARTKRPFAATSAGRVALTVAGLRRARAAPRSPAGR